MQGDNCSVYSFRLFISFIPLIRRARLGNARRPAEHQNYLNVLGDVAIRFQWNRLRQVKLGGVLHHATVLHRAEQYPADQANVRDAFKKLASLRHCRQLFGGREREEKRALLIAILKFIISSYFVTPHNFQFELMIYRRWSSMQLTE